MVANHINISHIDSAGVRHTLDIEVKKQMIWVFRSLIIMSETDIVALENGNPFLFKVEIILSMNIVKIRLPDVQLILHPFRLSSIHRKRPINSQRVWLDNLSETIPAEANQQYSDN